jgi:branched-subunit amino acid permease
LISTDLTNLILLPKNPFLDKKNKVAGFDLPAALQNLPLSEQNMAWLIPALIVLVISAVIDRIRN